jgi:hypothetical protein
MHITVDNVKFGFYMILQGYRNFICRFRLQAGIGVKILRFRWDKVTVREYINIFHQVMARVSEGLVLECIYCMCLKSSCRNVKQVSMWVFLRPKYHFIVYNLTNQHVATIFKTVLVERF